MLISQVFVWIVASLSEKSHEVLQFLDLIQVVNEGLGNLLDQKRSVGNFEFDLLLCAIVSLGILAHVLLCDGL